MLPAAQDVLWEMDWGDVPSELAPEIPPVPTAAPPKLPADPAIVIASMNGNSTNPGIIASHPANQVTGRAESDPSKVPDTTAARPSRNSKATPLASAGQGQSSPAAASVHFGNHTGKSGVAKLPANEHGPATDTPPPVPVTAPVPARPAVPTPAVLLVKGQRIDLAKLGIGDQPFSISFQLLPAPADMQMLCAGLGAGDKVVSKDYLIYANRMQSPCKGLKLGANAPGKLDLQISPALLPGNIQRVLIAAVINGTGSAAVCQEILRLEQRDAAAAICDSSGPDAGGNRSLLLAELYLRQGSWRLFVRSENFAGGQESFIRQYGLALQ